MGGPRGLFVALALVLEPVAEVRVQRSVGSAPAVRVDQSRSPAVADIIGARLACTVS
jgi:hypothetical protein